VQELDIGTRTCPTSNPKIETVKIHSCKKGTSFLSKQVDFVLFFKKVDKYTQFQS
jgi:hypothetical protein